MMTSIVRIVLPFMVLASLAACAINPRVQSNYNDNLSFAAYKTFNIATHEATASAGQSGDLARYFHSAIISELEERGLARSEDPDLLIIVSIDLTDVSRPPNRRNSCPRYEDYTGRKSNLMHGGFAGASRRPMCVYKEGQLTFALVDVAQSKPVLEGVARIRLDENDTGGNLGLSVATDVAIMFGESPARIDGTPSRTL
ncbi:MAG: DUF4136 domain-containing protein [Gammaproteobacteria bacterium]|nr:DUF4136 domain-containing protein [Gammaproteobacteria bacterium]